MVYTSNQCTGKKGYEVNRRMTYTMRSLGVGYTGLEKFCTFMDMPQPMTRNNFDKINKLCKTAAKEVAMDTMIDAANEIREKSGASDDQIVDTGVSVDGSWQKRGYASRNGVVTAMSIETGKVLDCEPMTTICNACTYYKRIKK